MAEPFLSEIRLFSFNFPPKGWAFCNGQLLPINQNQALFSLLGTTYGGNGQTTFALPNLQGRVPMNAGPGHSLGESGGEQAHTLTINETPAHNHGAIAATSEEASSNQLAANCWAASDAVAYSSSAGGAGMGLGGAGTSAFGGSQAHMNLPPYLTINFCI
ncbi:MAG TPA: tail fiber protein, partial [Chloroflexota bacterium]|nr:tail fiber protein [Chloroflexota bacterium]